MSIFTLFQDNPELIRGKMADVVDAATTKASYESNAPTGLPPLTDVEQWEDLLIGLVTETGQIVTPERAKRCATVLAIMRGLSEDISALPLHLYRRGENEDTLAVDHPVFQMLNMAPNDLMTPLELREHLMFEMMTWGGFFILKNDDPADRGQVSSLWPLQAGYVTRRWREPVWTFTDPLTGVSGTFLASDVWRGTILSPNGLDGTALTLLAREAIGLLLAAEQQGARLFNQGIQTDFTLEAPEEVGKEEKEDIRKALMYRHAGSRNAFMPLILSGGMTAKKLGLTAQESQYLEAREFQVADIARVFRYPDVLLGGSSKSSKGTTYASAEQFFESYTKHTLSPWTTRIEQTIHRDLLTQKERKKYYSLHDFSSLLKPNETARIANWNARIQGGWAQPAEARRAERMKYLPGLDYTTRPAGSTGVAGNPDPKMPDPTPTDQSGLARRIAAHILSREQSTLLGKKHDADVFYSNFGGYIESLTGASPVPVVAYLEMRRTQPETERFSQQGTDAALSALLSLCTEGK